MIAWYTAFFFKILNFFFVIVIFWYVIQKYLLSHFLLEIKNKKELQKAFDSKQQILEQNISDLEQITAKEEIIHSQLRNKIIIWRTIVEQKKQEQKQELARFYHNSTIQFNEQMHTFLLLKKYEKSIRDATLILQEQLKEYRHNKKIVEAFTLKTVNYFLASESEL